MNSLSKNRNIGLDLLKGVSILYIVGFWHLFNYTKAFPEYYNFITYRLTLVVLGSFIFISGYFVGFKDVTISKPILMQFYRKRLLRIYPLYLIAIILFTFSGLSNPITSIKAGFLISMLIKPVPITLWYIGTLLVFYIISPLLILAARTIETKRLILYCIIFMLLLLTYSYFTKMLDDRLVLYFPSFALGLFAGTKEMERVPKRNTVYAVLVISILFSFLETPYGRLNLMMNIPMVAACSYFLFRTAKELVVSSEQIYENIVILSYSSYCMYLFHRPIYMALKKIYFPETYLYQVVYLVSICLPCILFASFIIQKAYDVTIDMLAHKFSGRKKPRPLI